MKNSKYKPLLTKQLPRVFDSNHLQTELALLVRKGQLTENASRDIKQQIQPLPLRWNVKPVRNLFGLSPPFDSLELLEAWTSRSFYISHFGALYLNGLTDQRPTVWHLSRDSLTSKPSDPKDISSSAIRQAFMKDYRLSNNWCNYKNERFIFLDRKKNDSSGRIKRRFPTANGEVNLAFTDPERSLIDCVVSPQYAGGMQNIQSSMALFDIRLSHLKRVYESLSLTYPFWQTIGYLLDSAGFSNHAEQWYEHFGPPSSSFYFDRNYRSNWKLDKKWNLYVSD